MAPSGTPARLQARPDRLLAKYADFNSDGFASDTEKFWLQAEYEF